MRALPNDPFDLIDDSPWQPAARRALTLLGAPVELVWLPERQSRPGRPGGGRPAFPGSRVERILREESVWRDGGFALTPNRHPFASPQLLLWPTEPRREPDAALLEVGFALAERFSGTLLVNSTGAAASIPWAHAHLVGERLPFLDAMPLEPVQIAALDDGSLDVDLARAAAPFPTGLVVIEGAIEQRAAAAERLLLGRTCTAFSLIDGGGRTRIVPRTREVPAPWFPQALGTAEIWGRWCYDDRDAYLAATPDDLVRALADIGVPRDGL